MLYDITEVRDETIVCRREYDRRFNSDTRPRRHHSHCSVDTALPRPPYRLYAYVRAVAIYDAM